MQLLHKDSIKIQEHLKFLAPLSTNLNMGRKKGNVLTKQQAVEVSNKRKAVLDPVGQGPLKRTPHHLYDKASNPKETYKVEKIVSECMKFGETHWEIKWVGYDDKDNTTNE